MVRSYQNQRYAPCDIRRLDSAMDTTKNDFIDDAELELDELETWDADDLREELEDLQEGFDFGKGG